MRPEDEEGERLSRALLAFVRAEFQAPVASLNGLLDILSEDAAKAGLSDYAEDLARMRAAGARLAELVALLLEQPGQADTPPAKLRHDLRTPITAILGYGELIAEEARERDDTRLFEPLADVLKAAGLLLRESDKLIAFSGGARSGPDDAMPDVLRRAAAAVTRLAQHEPAATLDVTGRILVVDDNRSTRDLIVRRLERDGHQASSCGNGAAALDMTANGAFDLVLLDLMMPGMNGLEVLARLRARPETRLLPVIVISALDDVETAVHSIEAGADDFLPKPLNEVLLRARIRASLDRKFLRDREEDALRRLEREQARSELLLRNVLPAGVVERLRAGATAIADTLDDVTVLFCDIVGFTALSSRLGPAETLALLNGLFSEFDGLASEHGLEKIKTIGDAYMVVGGLPGTGPDHARQVVGMACGLPAIAARFRQGLTVRVGIDTGPAVAGIIGTSKFFYDVWGDTVNTASRLEASSEPGRIHVSDATRRAAGGGFRFSRRGPTEIRGKGLLETFYVAC